jgi:hypothetical protein
MSIESLPSVHERDRFDSPAVTPQALAWHNGALWMGSLDLRRIYGIETTSWKVFKEAEAPGIPWAAVSTDGKICFNVGVGADDDRYLQLYSPNDGFWANDRIACPDFTGSYISFDGRDIYVSQWYKHRILRLDPSGNILQVCDVGAEICGHTFYDGAIYILRGTEQGNEDWRIARLSLGAFSQQIKDLARVPFQCRSLAFDGSHFWTNHRVANQIVCFDLPE